MIFALQNAEAVTIRFLFWQLQSSVAVVALASTAAGVADRETLRVGEPPAALETRPARDGSGGSAGAPL